MIKKLCDRVSCGGTPFRVIKTMDFGKIFMRQGILLGNFFCDRVQSVERFATHPRHFPSQVPPPPGQILQENHSFFDAYQEEDLHFAAAREILYSANRRMGLESLQ